MAEKVHEDFFIANKGACLGIVKTICSSLPCPMCRTAAIKHMKNISVRDIPTKGHFKKMLFDFHNHVNMKLRKRQFTRKELYKYKRLRFITCTQLMCYQIRRFNKGIFNRPSSRNSNAYVDLVEKSIKKHIRFFI